MENFDRPYSATSISEFWRRWHMSLTSWFRDYVFASLEWHSRVKLYRNVLVVFLLSGLWHGADWAFVLWGVLHGMYLVIGSATAGVRRCITSHIGLNRMPLLHGLVRRTTTFLLVCFGWIFFRATSLADAATVIRHMGTDVVAQLFDIGFLRYQLFTESFIGLSKGGFVVLVLSLALVYCYDWRGRKGGFLRALEARYAWARWAWYYLLFGFLLFFGVFITRNFIYFQF